MTSEIQEQVPIVADATPQVQEQASQEQQAEETPEQINWRKFRQERAEAEKKRIAAEAIAKEASEKAEAMKAALDALLNKPQQQQNQYQQSSYEEEETDEKKIERKVEEALKKHEQKYQQENEQREARELPQRLSTTYSDFNNVCSQENLDYLEYHHPEIAKAFQYMPNGFDKWASIYQTVKKMVPNSNTASKDAKKIDKNLSKPQSMSVPGITPTGDSAPVFLDDARKKANWERMQKASRTH